jgi:hypothetical protein
VTLVGFLKAMTLVGVQAKKVRACWNDSYLDGAE